MTPDRPAGMGGDVVGDQPQTVLRAGGMTKIQAREPQSGGGQMHVAVDEGRRHQGSGEVDPRGVGELIGADGITAKPGDHPSRTAMAVASGCDGLYTRPLSSSVVTGDSVPRDPPVSVGRAVPR